MDTKERDTMNRLTACRGEEPQVVGEVAVRRLSLESLYLLELVGCAYATRFAAALNGQPGTDGPPVTTGDLALFLWVHAAPREDVLPVALGCTPQNNVAAVRAALEFLPCLGGLGNMKLLMEAIMRDVMAVRAANFNAKSPFESPHAKKNG